MTALMGTSTSGQVHETLVSAVVGEVLQRDPGSIRVLRADSLNPLSSNSPVDSRIAIMLGGAAAGAAKILRHKLLTIAAHNLEVAREALIYEDGNVYLQANPARRMSWSDLVEIAHRKCHCMPKGMRPGLQETFCWEVATGAPVDHCTPSPLAQLGQKGSGEAGYSGGPAAIASAVNDALAPIGVNVNELPMTSQAVWRASRAAGVKEPK